jgi:hypothetical protein
MKFYRMFPTSDDESTITFPSTLTTITGSSTTLTVSDLQDADGSMDRRYCVQSSEIDFDGASAATVVLVVVPVASTILRAYYIITEASDASTANAAIKLGYADADGTSNADVDAYVLGTTDAANGLITGLKALNAVQALTLGGTVSTGVIAAGKALTATHVQDGGTGASGKLKLFVEYMQ